MMRKVRRYLRQLGGSVDMSLGAGIVRVSFDTTSSWVANIRAGFQDGGVEMFHG